MPNNNPIFYSAADALPIPIPPAVFASGDTVLDVTHGDVVPDEIFIWATHDAAMTVTHHDANGLTIGAEELAHEVWGVVRVLVPDSAARTTLAATTGFTVTASRQFRRLHTLSIPIDLRGSSMDPNDKVTKTQEGPVQITRSPEVLRLRCRIANHPSPADSAFLRDLAQAGQAVWVWPCGGYAADPGENELPPYMQYDVLRRVACPKRKFDSHAGKFVLGLDGRFDLVEVIEETPPFTLPRAGQPLCFVNPALGNICFVNPDLGNILTV